MTVSIPYRYPLENAYLVVVNRNNTFLFSSWKSSIIEFQTPPVKISDNKEAKYTEVEILGRSEPIRAYASSTPRTIGFSVEYHWYSYNSVGGWDFINRNIKALQAVCYPQYNIANDLGYQPPPKILFYFGRLYRGIPCLVKSSQFEFSSPWVNPSSGKSSNDGNVVPFKTTVTLALQVAYDTNNIRGFADILSGNDTNNDVGNRYSSLINFGRNAFNKFTSTFKIGRW